MRKTVKYETPEIEITRFELETKIMNNIVIPGGGSGEDGNDTLVPGDKFDSDTDPDLDIPGF
ncbi:MAG: hypothetical protein ACLRZ9_02115 [Eubacterium sp.]